MLPILSQDQLHKLGEHKYSAQGCSVMDPMMQKFWRWLVEQIPETWAPNSLTIAGLALNVLATLILVFYSPDARHEAPRIAYLFFAVALFLYQSLDAIDGKQARRTKTNTPLGELFDHGCDSISTVFVIMGTCITLQLGQDPAWMFFECFSAMFLFYAAHWQTYVTGTLKFGLFDVTEGQTLIIVLHLLTFLFGPSIWNIIVPVLNIPMRLLPVYFSFLPAMYQCRNNFSVIVMEGGIGKNGSTVAGTSTIFPVVPITAVILLAFTIYMKSIMHVYELHPTLYILSFGLVSAKITNKLVVAHMAKCEMDLLDSIFIGPALLFFNQYFNYRFNEYWVLWGCFIFCTQDIIRFSYNVCTEICEFLGIYCFDITSKPRLKSSKSNGTKSKWTDS